MLNRDITISHKLTIFDTIKKLNELTNISRLILFVCSDDLKIIGSVTDGDIRRFLINKPDLSIPILDVCNKKFKFVLNTQNYIDFSNYIQDNLKILPVLDINHKLVELIDLAIFKSKIPVECVIMAGGRGKRLSPLTDNLPKPMLILGNKPIIEHNIDKLILFGIKKFYITLNYLGDKIVNYFGDGSSKGVEIIYIWETKPLGTAGSLSLIDEINSDHLLLINSDLFTNFDLDMMYKKIISNNADIVISSKDYKVDIPFAIFESKDSFVQNFKEKPTYTYHSNAGIYLIKSKLISQIPKNEFYDITDFIDSLLNDNYKVMHDPILGYWIDIGCPADYKSAQDLIKLIK